MNNQHFANITISLPIFMASLIVGIQPLPNQELSPPECRLGKWNLPALVNPIKKKLPVLIPRVPVTCCQEVNEILNCPCPRL